MVQNQNLAISSEVHMTWGGKVKRACFFLFKDSDVSISHPHPSRCYPSQSASPISSLLCPHIPEFSKWQLVLMISFFFFLSFQKPSDVVFQWQLFQPLCMLNICILPDISFLWFAFSLSPGKHYISLTCFFISLHCNLNSRREGFLSAFLNEFQHLNSVDCQ